MRKLINPFPPFLSASPFLLLLRLFSLNHKFLLPVPFWKVESEESNYTKQQRQLYLKSERGFP